VFVVDTNVLIYGADKDSPDYLPLLDLVFLPKLIAIGMWPPRCLPKFQELREIWYSMLTRPSLCERTVFAQSIRGIRISIASHF